MVSDGPHELKRVELELYRETGAYMDLGSGSSNIDGIFTADQLRRIADAMDKAAKYG